MLAVIETHPIQYHVPVYRALQQRFGVPVTAIYGSDFSVRRYRDLEFGAELEWDADLTGGIDSHFLSTVECGGAVDPVKMSARGVGAMLDRLAPRAVLTVGYSPSFHRRAWLSAWQRRLPLLFRGETTDQTQTSRRGIAVVRDLALRAMYRRCARILYIGERSRRHYVVRGVDASRLIFSPYCVDDGPFQSGEVDRECLRREARQEMGASDDSLVLLFCGKLSARKGVDLIASAVRALPVSIRDRTLVVCAGDGALRSQIEADAARTPSIRLRILGVQPQKMLSRWYHASDLLLLPSRQAETWGLVVNEALHHGVPCVVSTRVGCAPDLIDASTGVVCAPDSAEGLTAAIVAALPLAGSTATREACRTKVAGYSVERAAQGLAEAYAAATGTQVGR
jgi:glycosyltransferase involved in cell wall biosynthesis